MREIGQVRQDSARGLRRWFQDDYFDLYVWQDARGEPIAFQLCYARDRAEGAISWSAVEGYAHARVDSGRSIGLGPPMSPMLRPDGFPPYFRIYNRFVAAAADLAPEVRGFVLGRLHEYRHELFGRRRVPRRSRKARPIAAGA
jgi:hypothetical protein